MNNIKQFDKLIMKYLIVAAVLIFVITNYVQVFSWISILWTVISPVIIGAMIAYVINLLMIQIEKIYFPNKTNKFVKYTKRPVSLFMGFTIVLVILIFVISLIIPQLISVFVTMIETAPVFFTMVEEWFIEYEDIFPQVASFVQEADIDWQSIATQTFNILNSFTGNVIEATVSTIGSVFGFFVNIFLAFIISIYMLLSKERLGRQFQRLSEAYLPKRINQTMRYVARVFDESFRSFIVGETIEAVILGSMVTIGMWIFQLPYAGMIGALTGVMAYIPYVGAYFSAAVGVLLLLVESPIQALIFLILIVVIQQIESNLIYPRVVGKSIGLPGLWVLVGVTIGGGLWGIWGMLVGVPISSAIYQLLKDQVNFRERRKATS